MCINFSFAQKYCGTDVAFDNLKMPVEQYEAYQRRLKLLTNDGSLITRDQVYVIPVVFHIIHKGGIENVSDDQVFDQMRIINEDFRKLSPKVDDIIPEFQSIAADSKIEFKLAQIDPQGNCTSGIVRYYDERAYATKLVNADSLKFDRQWPREQYLNIYVLGSIETSNGGTTLGFAYYPITVDEEKERLDGIMQVYSSVGSFGTSAERYSGVLTHEIGHYFHLHHTWGEHDTGATACNEDDEVDDTPNTQGNPSVCNLYQESCGSLDNVQNFMDYSFCYAMLTEGQRVRMTAVLNDTIADRSNLWQLSNLIATGVSDVVLGELCAVDFGVEVDNACIGDTLTLFDKSYHYVKNWYWTPSGTPSYISPDSSTIDIVYDAPGAYDVSLAVANGVDSLFVKKSAVLYVHANPGELNSSYSESFNHINTLSELIWDGNQNGNIGFTKFNVGRLDTGSVKVNNYEAGNVKTHVLQTTTFDLSNEQDLQLVFDVAFAQKTSPCLDKLTVFVSKDCGENWVSVQSYDYLKIRTSASVNGGPFVPSSNQWRTITTNLPDEYNVQATRFKLEYYSLNGNNFYLDNFKLQLNPNSAIAEQSSGKNSWRNGNNQWVNQSSFPLQQVTVFDMQGRQVVSSKQHIIDHSQLQVGIYIIRWLENGNLMQQKVIKH